MSAPYRIELGDCRESLRAMAARGERVQMCVTSPPYFGLRDYGHDGQIGLEQTPEEYIAAMVEVFRCVRDVLADDGTLWVNIGDSYATTSTYNAPRTSAGEFGRVAGRRQPRAPIPDGVKAKDLIGIPWMLAFALRADGWYLRQEIIWNKPNPMPESVRDRCTKSREQLFLLTKSQRYYFDSEAIKEPVASSTVARLSQNVASQAGSDRANGGTRADRPMKALRSKANSFKRDGSKREQAIPGQSVGTHRPNRAESTYSLDTRNRRSVWTIATRPYKGAHFATFPPDLVIPCVLAGSRPGDTILDPFGGSGTTAGVAAAHGRRAVLCELNPEYAALVPGRVASIIEAHGKAVKLKRARRPPAVQLDLLDAA